MQGTTPAIEHCRELVRAYQEKKCKESPRGPAKRPIMPHEALAFVLALVPRLGANSMVSMLSLDLIRNILHDLHIVVVTVIPKPFRACVWTAWTRVTTAVSEIEGGEQAQVVRPQYFPSLHWLGKILMVNTTNTSKKTRELKIRWRKFLTETLGGLFYNFTVIFPHMSRRWDTQTILFESDARQPVHGNNADLVQGLVDGFFDCIGMHKPVFRVRIVEDVMQLFIFGPAASAAALEQSSTFRTPFHKRTLLQPHDAGYCSLGGWCRIPTRVRKRKRVMLSDLVQGDHCLDCLLE